MSDVKYLDTTGLHTLVNGLKMWVVNKVTEWWGTLNMSHGDTSGSAWGYKVSLDKSGGDLQYSPRLLVTTNDWMYSDWVKSDSDSYYPFTCAPSQGQYIKNGGKYPSYYFDSVLVNPNKGGMECFGFVYSGSFSLKSGGSSTKALMSDGTTMEISTLNEYNTVAMATIMPCGKFDELNILSIAYKLSDDTFNLLKNMNFFQTIDEGLTFSRVNDSSYGYPRFVTKYVTHLDTIDDMVAYVVKSNGNYTDCNYAMCFTCSNTSAGENLTNFPSSVEKIDEFFEFDNIVVG